MDEKLDTMGNQSTYGKITRLSPKHECNGLLLVEINIIILSLLFLFKIENFILKPSYDDL